ncbi:NAD(P)/FAD-dependent oxidoreductase [Robiginitalea sp. IMCC43444]|uniref:NAD(P)/FAD-dependent oxidoreductase n=1 Tax=Robiginitalea sp. IMCC43444 TaxID=3459121 RepID=UPI0040416911
MKISYWEYQTWLSELDYCIIGSGITGISCALELREKEPQAKILILEKGSLPQGASTKNAGFACFGSLTEILDDLKTHSEEEVLDLVGRRWNGIRMLRDRLGNKAIGYEGLGGYELFQESESGETSRYFDKLDYINNLLKPVFGAAPFKIVPNTFGFRGVLPDLVHNPFEGQIDTGNMMHALLTKAREQGVQILNGISLHEFEDSPSGVLLQTSIGELSCRKLLLATNGFAGQQIKLPVSPARAQVLVTTPIANLPFKGTFHLEKGYYYFRNIGNRVLFGGGRNLDKAGETTTEFGQTEQIQSQLEKLLREVILPDATYEISHRWSGIMGVGSQKKPILRKLSDNVSCGVRLGGMGVAIGSQVGAELAQLGMQH